MMHFILLVFPVDYSVFSGILRGLPSMVTPRLERSMSTSTVPEFASIDESHPNRSSQANAGGISHLSPSSDGGGPLYSNHFYPTSSLSSDSHRRRATMFSDAVGGGDATINSPAATATTSQGTAHLDRNISSPSTNAQTKGNVSCSVDYDPRDV